MTLNILRRSKNYCSIIQTFNYSNAVKVSEANSYVQINDDDRNGAIRRIIMVNDGEKNALSLNAIKHLQNTIQSTDLNKFRLLILTAGLRKVWSSGHNLKELTDDRPSEYHAQVFSEMTVLCNLLRKLPIPTIAEVYGLAAAAGCQLALSCDLVVASDKASFSTPGVKFGVFCSTPGVAVARNTSNKIAMKMLLTGDAVGADEALKHGLISEVVAADRLEARVNELAEKINSNSKPIIALGKQCFYEQTSKSTIDESYKVATTTMIDNLKYVDTQDGLRAFALKKKPTWSHISKKVE